MVVAYTPPYFKQDLELVSNYKTGDIPEVVIDKIIVGRRV